MPAKLGDDDVKAWIVPEPGADLDAAELHGWFAEKPAVFRGAALRAAHEPGTWDFEAQGLTIQKARRRGR